MTSDPIREAYERAAGEIAAMKYPQQAYFEASQLRDLLDELVGCAARLRAQTALRIMRAENLSISQLAERLGTSKSRAAQLINAADID